MRQPPAPPDNSWNLDWDEILKPLQELKECAICPRECHVDRTKSASGYCKIGAGFPVDSIFPHRGEEPILSGKLGICNVFFSHCNMQCIYCQNYQISDNLRPVDEGRSDVIDIVKEIEWMLGYGIHLVGFVSPSHVIPQTRAIISTLKARGRHPAFVFNTNGYDKAEVVRQLEGTIDVYLPDLKYMDNNLAKTYSDAPDYVEVATVALREMHRQKGSNIWLHDDGTIRSGLIIRHLVLPGHVENSKAVLRFIAEELSPSVHVSLMAQYYPTSRVIRHPALGRTLKSEEYEEVVAEFEKLGFYRGWVQDLSSPHHYRPDFLRDRPFEGE